MGTGRKRPASRGSGTGCSRCVCGLWHAGLSRVGLSWAVLSGVGLNRFGLNCAGHAPGWFPRVAPKDVVSPEDVFGRASFGVPATHPAT